jgi:hypothetical protein
MKKFILPFVFYSIALMSLSYGLIIAVDPYDKLGINLFGIETKAVASSRENKFHMLERAKVDYEAFILGSSTAHRYVTDDLEKLTGLKTFNYAVQHTTPEDYVAILNHIKSKFKPKLIIIQVAFVDLDINYKTDKRLASSPLGKFIGEQAAKNTYMSSDIFSNQLITLDALRDTFRVIGVNLFGKARHIYLEHGNYKKEKPSTGKIKVVQFSHQNWKVSKKRVEIFKKLQTSVDQLGAELVIISAPLAPDHLARIKNNPHMSNAFDEYKKTITSVFTNVHDFTTDEMKQYNSTEFFHNSTHPSKKLSKIILEKIWSKK